MPVVFIMGLVAALFFVPTIGGLARVFSPVPIIFVYLTRGKVAGLILIALVFGVILSLKGVGQALLFFAGDAVMALIISETIVYRMSFDKSIFFGTLGSWALSLVWVVALFSGGEVPIIDYFQKEIEQYSEQSLQTLESMGEDKETLAEMRDFSRETSGTLAAAFPFFIFSGALLGAILNYLLVRVLWTRFYGSGLFSPEKFSDWVFPEQFVWVLIGSGGLYLLAGGFIEILSMNVFLGMLTIYFFQGLAVTIHILRSKNIPVFVWWLMFLMVLFQPLLVGVVMGVGVFDLWGDFRKLKTRPS